MKYGKLNNSTEMHDILSQIICNVKMYTVVYRNSCIELRNCSRIYRILKARKCFQKLSIYI